MIMYLHQHNQQQSEPMLIHVADLTVGSPKLSRKRSRSQIQRSTSSSAPEPKKRRISKEVRFAAALVQIIPATPSLDHESSFSTWYSHEDSNRFRANIKRDVRYLARLCHERRLPEMDCNEYCSVGLERFCCTEQTRQRSKALREIRIRSVLDHQYAQKQLFGYVTDPLVLSRVAQKLSQKACERALLLAARLSKINQ